MKGLVRRVGGKVGRQIETGLWLERQRRRRET